MAKVSFPTFSKLKSKEVKLLLEKINKWYGAEISQLRKYSFYVTSKGKLYLSSIAVEELKTKRITGIGMYFGTFPDEKRFRLSIEGSKLIKPKKNYIKLNKKSILSYISGENLFKDEIKINTDNTAPFLIVQYNEDNIGVTSVSENIINTFIPKGRRLNFNKMF